MRETGTRHGAQTLSGPVIAIAGPTASGKSELAACVAQRLGTGVVSADAMQVYRGMDIGTAKDTHASYPLLMVDVVDVSCPYSVEMYQVAARRCVDELLGASGVAVLCGGTGLYMDAVVDEMTFPAGGETSASRQRWERFAKMHGPDALYAELVRRDFESAALVHPHNVRRVVRALEMNELGISYARKNKGLHQRGPHYDTLLFAITLDRERLYARIDARVDHMFGQGLVDEVEGLLAHGLRESKTARQAIGYKEVVDYLDGACSLDEARELTKRRTRHYAKRQLSWLRRRDDVRWLDYDRIDLAQAQNLVLHALNEHVGGVGEGRLSWEGC